MRVCTLAAFLALLLVVGFAASQENTVRYNATTLQGSGEGCPPDELREAARANISEDVRVVLQGVQLGVGGYSPIGCSGSGWTRIAYLNMNDSTQRALQTGLLSPAQGERADEVLVLAVLQQAYHALVTLQYSATTKAYDTVRFVEGSLDIELASQKDLVFTLI